MVSPGVKGKILSLALAAVVVTALCSAVFIVQTQANIKSQVFSDQAALGQAYARTVHEYLSGSQSMIEMVTRIPAVRAPLHPDLFQPALHGIPENAEAERRASLAALIDGSGRVDGLIMAAANGDVYLMEPYAGQPYFPLTNLRNENPEIFEQLVQTEQPTWSNVIPNPRTGLPTLVLLLPIKDDAGAMQSMLGVSLGLQGLTDAALAVQTGRDTSVTLFDSRGIPIVYPDASRVQARQPLTQIPLVQSAVSGQAGSFAYHNPLTGRDELGTSVALNNGWFAIISESQSDAFATLNQTTVMLLLVLLAGALVLLGAGLFLARSIASGLGKVALAATGLAAGDLDQQVNVWSKDELGRMAAAFREMIGYHQRMAAIADAVAAGDLSTEVQPQSSRDRLGIALHGMIGNLRQLVSRLEERTVLAEHLVGEMQVQIAERQRVEQALQVRERAMSATTTAIAISELGAEGYSTVYVNPAFERLTGYSALDMHSRSMQALSGPLSGAAETAEIRAALSEQRETAVTTVSYRQDGSHFWSDVTLAPIRDGDTRATHFVWLVSDVSERKQAEKQAEALGRTEKLRALGQMASGIAHDLNQSLMLIASYGTLGQRALDAEPLDRDELREMFTVVTQAALDGGGTVKRLLLLARAPMQGTEPIDLTLLVREVVQLTAPRWRDASQGEGRPIRLDLETVGHPIVIGSPSALRDALMNLILNAVDALPTGGTIHVRSVQRHDEASVEIGDDGIGMTPEVQSKIFEPFFTTKGDKGTGLGLATVFGVVERLGGQIRVHSAPGKGTEFRLILPASNLPIEVAPAPAADSTPRTPQRQLRILAVDDEPALTKAVVRLLRPVGHLVTTAISGEEALEHLSQQTFDVVLSDVGMGAGMSGWDLAERVRADWPEVRFVLATGWGAGIDPAEARDKGVAAVLAKPYDFSELEQVLAAA